MTTSYKYPCHEAYKKGITDRKKYPFVWSSLYKIREFHYRLERLPDNLINIGKCSIGNKMACHSLKGCVSNDKAFYTKKMPRNIAYDLGFKVVSALSALKHEGLTQQDVDRITAHVNVRIQAVLNTAELALQKLKRNWKQEARYLASGEGDMYQLSLEALALVDWVMAEVELCKQLP
jgi:hypothetical protein